MHVTTRRTFIRRALSAVMATVAAVYAPSCLRAVEPRAYSPQEIAAELHARKMISIDYNFHGYTREHMAVLHGPDWDKSVPHPTI